VAQAQTATAAVADQEETDMLRARSITTIGTVMALAVPAAAGAQQQDWRAPDRVDARHEGLIIKVRHQDLRAPDRVDAGRTPSATRAPRVDTAVAPSATSSANGFEWGDAGIGAAGMLGIVGLVGGGVLLTARRRHDHPVSATH
jgi:hypothetical protein